ncbi:hypothetical protein [Mesorhizobium escarrei]|nr:hypothetical protein [Mesorhizobium escarrei]
MTNNSFAAAILVDRSPMPVFNAVRASTRLVGRMKPCAVGRSFP